MGKTFIREVGPHQKLYRDEITGIAWVEDGTAGIGHSSHPNISDSGSVAGMKAKGLWAKGARTVRSHGFIYNIDLLVVGAGDDLDEIARQECRCGGVHQPTQPKREQGQPNA